LLVFLRNGELIEFNTVEFNSFLADCPGIPQDLFEPLNKAL
jgi:hypothetical protein